MNSKQEKISKIGSITGISIVLANMIGTGVFTSLGFQLKDISNISAIITLWILGGVFSLCGALSYAEIGTKIKKSGGEYAFLTEIYNPFLGYLSGWISMTVGFAAPIVLSALAFAEYFPIQFQNPKIVAACIIAIITLIHSISLKTSSNFQNASTLFKIILIVSIIIAGFILPSQHQPTIHTEQNYFSQISSAAFGIAFIYITYSYSGWNAAAYITNEFKKPEKSIPIALLGGTIIVTLLYTLLQIVFLKHASVSELIGQINIGTIVINNMMGAEAGKLFGSFISLLLLSGISAMVWIGSRVTASISNDYQLWSILKSNKDEIPKKPLWFQFLISILLLFSGTFEQIMIYCGVLLTLSAALTVLGVIILRLKNRNVEGSFKSPLYPIPQIIFLIISFAMIIFAVISNPTETGIGLISLLLGGITFLISKNLNKNKLT